MPKRQRDIGRKHRKSGKSPEQIAAERAENARANGRAFGGRHLGSRNVLPVGAKDALDRLNERKFRVKKELDGIDADAAGMLTGYARSRLYDVLRGGVNSKKSPSVLKAAMAAMSEFTEPIATAVNVNHSGSIASAVAEASKRVAAASAPPAGTQEDKS